MHADSGGIDIIKFMKNKNDQINDKDLNGLTTLPRRLQGKIPATCIVPGCDGRIIPTGNRNQSCKRCSKCRTEYYPIDRPHTQPQFAVVFYPDWLKKLFTDDIVNEFQKAVVRREAQRVMVDIKRERHRISRLVLIGMGGLFFTYLLATLLFPEIVIRNQSLFGTSALTLAFVIGSLLVRLNRRIRNHKMKFMNLLESKWAYEKKCMLNSTKKPTSKIARDDQCHKE